MLVVYCDDAMAFARVRTALPGGVRRQECNTWDELERRAADAEVVVAIIPRITVREVGSMARFRQRRPVHPMVLVTEKDAERLRLLAPITLHEVVWIHEAAAQLAPAIARARVGTIFHELADRIRRTEHISPVLREALARAAESRQPIRRVQRLAEIMNKSPDVLDHHWHVAVRPESELRLEDYLDWFILLRALQRKRPNANWTAASDTVGVSARTLQRIAHRLTGSSLHDLESVGFKGIAQLCRQQLLKALLGASDAANSREIRNPVLPGQPRKS